MEIFNKHLLMYNGLFYIVKSSFILKEKATLEKYKIVFEIQSKDHICMFKCIHKVRDNLISVLQLIIAPL